MSRLLSYPKVLRERAVRMVAETKGDYLSEFEAIKSVAAKLGIGSAGRCGSGSVRLRSMPVDAGVTSEESAQLKAFKNENAELRRANEILKGASAFFAERPHRF